MGLLINVDVPEIEAAAAFYTAAFGLRVTRRFGGGAAELSGWPVPLYLLRQSEGSIGAGNSPRQYDRHWTPVHLDVVVDDIDATLVRAIAAGARLEAAIQTKAWGKLAVLADPFGHGICLIEFLGRGYDEIADPTRDNLRLAARRRKDKNFFAVATKP